MVRSAYLRRRLEAIRDSRQTISRCFVEVLFGTMTNMNTPSSQRLQPLAMLVQIKIVALRGACCDPRSLI